MLATGMVAWPSFSPVYAAPLDGVVRSDGGVTKINGNVGDYYVGKQNGAVGVNVFNKFNVASGEIANLQFHNQEKTYTATHLLNFVQERINVSGTVNAIRNNRIGGNLYFISSNGMIVNEGGAINAGALTVMAPQYSHISKAFSALDDGATNTATEILKGMIKGDIPLNPSGSIVINGTVRTGVESRFMAANIVVGKDLEVDGEDAAQFNADGTLKVSGDHNARIVNGVNFSSIVNTAGLEGCKYELPADFDTDTTGQYRLNLQKEVVDGDDVYYLLDAPQGIRSDGTVTLQAKLGVEKTSIETVTGSASIKTNIEIGKDAVIDSVGSVNIAATSDASPSGVDFSLTLAFLDAIANVNVDGTITAGHNVDINANATSTSMHFGPGDFTTGIITKILTSGFDAFNPAYYAGYAFSAFKENLTPFLMGNAITFIKATAKADVKVGATANVTAKDDVNVQGMSTAVAMGMRSVTPNKTYDVLGGQQPYENINFVMANLDSVCNVDIEGNLTAEEGTVQAMAISAANATTLPTIAANEHNVGASYSGYANVGIGIDLVKNKANLTIGENAKIDAGAAAVLGSMTDTGASNCLELETDQRAAFNTGVGYVQMDANANTDIKGSVTSAGVVNIMANATVSGNENKVDNASKLAEVLAYGTKEWKLPPDQFEVLMPEENKINVLFLQELFKFMGQIGKNGEAGAAGGGGDAPAETNIFEKFDFGASIGITKVNNNSKVEVGKNAKIYSLGPDVRSKEDANDITSALTIAANSSVAPITVKTKANMTDTAKEEGTAVSAAVSVSVEDIVNNADVVVDARDSKTTAQTISGGEPIYLPAADIYAPMGTVTINATTLVGGYGPINWYNKLKDIFVGNPDKDIKSFPEVLKDFFLGIGDKFTTSKKVTAEFEKVFGITADGGQNLVKDENYDGSLYMDDVLQKLQQVEENTNGGLSQMLLEFKNDYQDTFNSVYDVANSEQKFIDHDSRDFTNDGVAGQGGTTVDLVFKAPVQHDVMGLVTTLIDLLIEVPKAMDPAGMACNIAATAQSGSNADPNHNSLSFSGAAAYFRSNNSANVVIGRNVQIEGGRVDIGANEKQIAINILTGKQSVKILKLPTPYDVSGMFAIGGNVAINNISNDAVVLVAEGAEIRTKNTTGDPDAATYHDAMLLNSYQMEADKAAGKDTDDILEYMSLIKNSGNVDVNSISDDVNIAAVLGGGKAMKLGLTGMAAVLKGHNYSYVGIDDEAKLNAEKTITIQGINKSVLASAVMDLTKASGVGIGASAGVLDFDIDNLVMVADNDILSATPNGSTYTITLPSDANNPRKDREAEDFIKKLNQVLGGQYAQAGTIGTNLTGGEIEGDSLTLDAKTSGFRLNITLAGTETDARWENVEPSAVPEIGVAGSVSVNDFVSRTDAILETPKVTLHAPTATVDSGHLKINAADSGFVGAISGAAAVAFHITQSEDPNPGARLAGAVALNNITRDTVTEVFGTNIVNAVEIENYADSSGTQVAAGLSAGLSIEEKSSSEIDATASVSKNTVVSETKAILKKATTQNALNAVVNNIATAKDIQVAGGINLNAAGNDFACFGVATAFNTITNTIEARIEEGTYDVKTLNNYANSQLKQVAGAVAVGLQLKEAGKFTGQGAGATNTISNTVKSISQDANITADKVDMLAWDGVLTLLPDQENIYIKYLQDKGFDINGDWALDLANSTAGDMDMDVKDDPSGDPEKPSTVTYKTNKFTDGGKKGNTMVSFAAVAPFDVAGEDKKVKALGSVVKNTLTNVFDTTISGGTITAKASDGSNALSAQAKADSRLVAVAAGVAAGTGTSAPLQAAGSVVLNNITDTVGALVQNSTIKSDKTYIYANDLTNVIGVAGALGVYKSGENSIASGGLTWAQGTLNNLTSAKMLGTNLDEYNSGKKAGLTLNAANDFTIHSIAAEVNANFQFDSDSGEIIVLRGAYAFNQGTNSIEALVDKTTDKASVIANGGNITVATNDTATEQAIAVAVGLDSSKMSGGVHIAKSYIGEEAADKHQHNFAKIQNTTITLAGADSALKVEALDNSKLTTIAVGGGLDKNALFGLNGSVAKAQNYKDVIAALDTNTISVNSNLTAKEISVHANNTMAMTTSADGASVGNKSLVIGAAGVATNDSVMTTKAYINGNNTDAFKTGSVDVSALSDNTLTNVGISLTGDISNGLDDSKPLNLDVLANVAKNKLKNDTIALVENFKVDADKTVTVKAKSEEKITNVVGAANIMENTGSDTALNFAFGASVAVNTITGSTLADLLNSNINVGNGLYVNADAFHKNKNVVFSGGLIVSQSKDVNVTLSANAIVSDNEISGETKARLYKTDVNKDVSASQAAVEVTAKDNIKLDSTTANAQMQVTIGDSNINILLGAGVLYEDNNRSVKALAAGENGSNKSTVNAKTFKVDANSTQTDNVVNACVGVSIAIPSAEAIAKMFTGKPPVNGSGAASVATTHVDLKGITLAQVDYVNTDNQGLTVNAFHKDTVNATGVGAAGTFGLFGLAVGVSVYKFTDDSKTISLLQNSTVTHENGTVADDEIIAKNESKLTSDVYAIAAGLNVGIAGAVAVWENNFNSSTLAKVADTNIGTVGKRAGNLKVLADTDVTEGFASVAGGISAVGIGANRVRNTLNTTTNAEVTGGGSDSNKIYVNSAEVKAQENRKVTDSILQVPIGALEIGVSDIVTNIGFVGDGNYTVTYSDKVVEDTVNSSNENLGENNSINLTDGNINAAKSAENQSRGILRNSINSTKLNGNNIYDGWSDVGELDGLTQEDISTLVTFTSGVHSKVTGVTLDSTGSADISTNINNNISSTSKNYPMLAGVGVNVIKNLVTLHQDNSVDIDKVKIRAGNTFIGNVTGGEIKVHAEDARLLQGLTIMVVKSSATRNGGTEINVQDSDLIGLNNQNFRNLDTLKLNAEVVSAGNSVLAGSYLEAETKDTGTMALNIGVSATDKSSSLYSNGNITFENLLAPQLNSGVYYGGGKIASGQGTLASAWLGNEDATSTAKTISLDVSDTSIFANNVQVTNGLSDNNGQQAKLTVDEEVTSVSVLEIAVNKGRTTSIVNVGTNFNNIKSNAALANAYRTANNIEGTVGVADWHVFANSTLDISNNLKNADVGIGICTGTNYTRNYVKNTTTLGFTVANGTAPEEKVLEAKSLEFKANSVANGTVHTHANDGGIIEISPVAAGVKNEMTFDTSVSIGGNFVVTGKADIQSQHSSDLYLFADGHCGSTVGGSGVMVNNKVVVNNTTSMNAANITTGDTLTVKTNTFFDLNKNFNVEEGTPDDFMLYSSNKGGLANGCGSYLTSDITITDKTNITNSTLQSQGNLVIGSYGDHHIYVTQSGVSSSAIGGGNNSVVSNTINKTDEVNINQDSGKTTELLTLDKNADIYLVATDITDASAKCFSEHTFSIVFAGAGAHLTDNITRNNKININGGTIFSYKGVNLFTNLDEKNVLGKMLLQESSRTFTSGAITIPYSNITSTLKQNNQVTVGGGAEVYSIGDVNIYADKGTETINRKSGSYCWYKNNQKEEFVSTSNGGTSSSVTRNNFVDVKGTVTAGVLNNFEIYIGKEGQDPILIVPDDATKTTYFDGAGNSFGIYTAGQYGQYISFGFVDDASGTVEEKEAALYRLTGINKAALKPELVDMAIDTDKRLNEIQRLLGEYSSDGTESDAYRALKKEEQLLIDQMARRGLAGGTTDGAQRISENMRVKVPDIIASGGNVHIETDTLKGTGKITANGMQEVKITNNTSTLLEVHNISVVNPGGQITFNGKVLDKTNYKNEIKGLNVDKSVGDTAIPTLVTQASGTPTITISGLWSGANVKYKEFTDGGETVPAGSLILPADIYILGTVENLTGNVYIKSLANDIVVNSSKDSGIRGANITLQAEQGGIVQMAPESTINIGQSPEIAYRKLYDDFVTAYKSDAGKRVMAALRREGDMDSEAWGYEHCKTIVTGAEAYALGIVNEEHKDADKVSIDFGYAIPKVIIYKKSTETVQWNSRGVSFDRDGEANKRKVHFSMYNLPTIVRNDGDRVTGGSAGYIAGDKIFIQGRDINIDGIIQSGYGEYRLNLTVADEGVINSIKQRYRGGDLTDAQVLNNSAYCIREGGAAWDSASQSYRYEMAAYYNPATDTVVVPTVNSRGGDIYLNGRIVSTGNGEIKCLDGVSTININNTYNHNLSVSDLTVSEVQGRVTISDDGLMRNVSIYRNEVKSEKYEGTGSATGHVSGSNGSFSYQPKSGLSYEWLSGEQQNTIKTYEGKKRATWWGWSKYKDYDPQTVIDEAEDKHEIGELPAELRPRREGNYITEEATTQNEFLKITRTYTHVAGVKTLSGPPSPSTSGYLGCHKWLTFQWTEKNGYTYTNEARVKADYPIKIDFIGVTADNGMININNIGNVTQDKVVTINGNVGNTQLYDTGIEKGRVNIQSNGAIKQLNGSIYGQTVDLSAKGNIENIKITAGNIVNLDAWSTAAGSSVKVDVTAQGSALGNINLGAFGGGNNNVFVALADLTAQGNIQRATNAVNASHNNGVSLVKADRIDLVSTNGGIGTVNSLFVNGGQIADTNNSMSASVNANAKNDIRLEQVDGTLRAGKIFSSDGSLFIHVPNGGIVDAQMAVATPESEITTKKDLISEWASIGVIDDGSEIAKKQIAMKNEQLKREREVLIIERDAEGTSAERKAQINKQLAEMPTEYTPWDADKLLYAMQASIFNPEAGVTASPKDPNLYGKNINLSVASNVGILSEDVKTISTVGLYDQNPDKSFKHLDDIRAISWADPGTVKYDKDKKEITIVNKIAIGVQHQTTGSLVVMDMSNNAVSGNVYIEGRDLHSTDVQNRNIDIFAIRAMGDVRLTSLGNLTASSSSSANGLDVMTHGDLFLSVGDAADNAGFSLGSEANPFFVQAAGNVQVLATGDIYLKSLGDLNVLDIVAGRKGNDNGGKIYLEAVKNNDIANSGSIYGVVVPNQDIQGYIRSDGNKSITLKAERNIGSWDDKSKTVRIKNADTVTADNKVNLSATSEIVVEGVSTAPVTGEQQAPQGVFSIQDEIRDLSEVGRKRISITVNGTLLMAGDLILNYENPDSLIVLKADKLEFNDGLVHANTINLQSVTSLEQGAESAIVGINVNLVAGVELDKFTYGTTMLVNPKDLANARVAQKDEAILRAYNLNVTSNADIDLGSQANKIFNVTADAQKSIQIASGSLRGSTLGYDENAVITATVKNSHDVDNKVHGDVIFMVYDTDIVKNNLYGKGDFLATGDIMFYDEAGNLDLHNDGGKIMADGTVVLMANTDLNAGKPIYAGKGLGIIAKEDVTALPDFAWVDGGGFYVESLEGNINASLFNAMVGSKDAGGNITYVNGNIKMIAEKGSINNINSLAMYAHDDVELRAKTNITNDAGIYSENGNIEIYTLGEGTDEGKIFNNNELITQNGYVLLYGNKGVTNTSSIVAASVAENDSLYRDEAGYVTILSNTKIANTNDVDANREVIKADKGVYMFAGSEGLTNSADIEVTKGDVILYGVGEYRGKGMEYLDNTITGGNVTNSGNIFTNEGNIDLNAGAGLNNTTTGSIHTKKGDITLYAGGDLANEKDIYTEQGNVDITAVGNLTSSTGNLVALGDAETEGNLTLISEQGNITYAMHADGSGNGGVAINSEYFGLSTGKLTMMATEEAADKGKISINSSLYAGRGISIIADKEIDVSADHGIVAKDRDIEIISKNGHLNLLGDITAEGATEGNIILSGKGYVKSMGAITINKGDFAATATAFVADDPATLTDDQKGYITIGKDVATDKLQVLNGKITMTAADKISLETAANAKTGFTATAGSDFTTTEMGEIGVYNGNILVEAGKNIDNAGKVYVTTGGNIIMEAKSGSFGNTNTGKITANQGYIILFADPNITNGGQISTVNGFINLSVMGGFANSGTINSATTGDIEITADNNINSATGTISAKTGNITVVSHNGDVSSKIISAEKGNIGIKAGNGDVTNKESISTQNGKISINAMGKVDNTNSTISTTTTGDIIVNAVGILDSSNGTISTVSGKIDLTAGGDITSKIISTTNGGINVTSQGKITNSESISTAETGDVVLKATDDITSKAIMTKNGGIEITGQGDITSSEKISSTEAGDIILTAGKGIKDETGTISTKEGSITLTANNGDIVTTNVNTLTGDISVITKGTVNGDVICNNSITTTNGNISIDAAGKVESINGTISTAETGDIKILATGILNSSNGTISTKTGKIDLIASGAITSKTINTVTGDITIKGFDDVTSSTEISVAGTGEIYVTSKKALANNGLISTDKGNICLTAETDITSKDVKTNNGHIGFVAKNNLANSGNISSTNGNVFLFAGNKILNSGVDKSIKAGQNIIMFIAEKGLENRGKIEAGTLNGTTQGSVVMGDFSDFVVGGTVASESFISAETFALIDSLLGEYASEIKGYESKGDFVNTGDITAHKGWVYFSTAGESMENSGVLLSQEGNVYLGCDGTITNSGIITAKDENVAIAANGIKNHANIKAQKSVFLLSTADIYNGEESGSPSTDIYIYAGDDILLLTKNGLDNKSGLIAGTDITDGSQGHGGDIFLDDYEFLRKTDKLDADTKGTLISLAGKYWSALVGYESNASIENEGNITAYKGTEGNGLVHLDSQDDTKNTGDIVSVDGEVFMDSTADLINSGSIYVTNADTTGSASCDVTLQATGNVYNAGDIYVEGKGTVLLDADSLNGAGAVETSTVATVVFKGIYNTGDIYAEKGDVSFKAANGDIYNADELTSASETVANGNISMWAPKGSVNNTKSLSATQSISIEALTDIYNLPTSATGADNISVSRGLQTQNGDIVLKSNNGNIWNDGTIIVEEEGDVKLTAKGNIVNTNGADTYVNKGNVTFRADSLNAAGEVVTVNVNGEDIKGIYNTGDIYAVEGDVTFETINGDIYNADSLTTSDSVTCSNGSITMNAIKGEIVNTKALVATKDIWMGSWSDIYNLADSDTATTGTSVMRGLTTQNGNITLISYGATENEFEGLIVNKGTLTVTNGDLTVRAYGSKKITDVIPIPTFVWEEGTPMKDDPEINYSFLNDKEGNIQVTNGEVKISTIKSVITFGDMEAKKGVTDERENSGNIAFTSDKGNVIIYSVDGSYAHDPDEHEFKAERDMLLKASEGYVYSDKAFISEGDMVLEYGSGMQDLGEIKSNTGSVYITATGHNYADGLTINASVTAAKNIEIVVGNGQLTVSDSAGTAGTLHAGEDIVLTADDNVTIENAAKLVTDGGGLELTSNRGGIDVTGHVTAKDFVRIYTKGESTDERAGNYADRFAGDYSEPTAMTTPTFTGIKVDGNIVTDGDIDIATYGDDVTLKNVTAGKMAAVGTSDGKVKIEGTIKGQNVALYSEKATADIEFEKINVEEKLILAGNNWNLDMTNVDSGGNPFDLYVYGAIGADGTVNLSSSVKLDYRNGPTKDVRIRQLNAVNVEVHTDGALTIDNLSIANKAELYVMGTKTNVYGIMQGFDPEADFIYYDPGQGQGVALDLSHVYFGYDLASRQKHIDALSADPTIFEKPAYNPDNCPICAEDILAAAGTGTTPALPAGNTVGQGGKCFEQTSASRQKYAGILLADNYGFKSYGQRFSAEDMMIHLEDIKAMGQFDNYFNIGLNFFERFNIIDIPDVAVNSITLNNTFRDSGIIVVRDDKEEDKYEF